MITIRFPNGQAIQYNQANYVTRRTEYSDLYIANKPGGPEGWIAQVPNSCVIEVVPACRVYNAVNALELQEIKNELAGLRREIRSLARKMSRK